MFIDNVIKISGTPQGPGASGRSRAACKEFYHEENRTRLRSLLVDPSSLDSSMDGGQRRQGPDARGMLRPSLLSLWPVIMDWGRGEWVWVLPAEPSLARGRAMDGRGGRCCGPELGAGAGRWWAGLAGGGRGLTYVHTRLLRTSGGPRCSRSRGRGGGRRPQPLCSCPPAAGHTSCSTRSHP